MRPGGGGSGLLRVWLLLLAAGLLGAVLWLHTQLTAAVRDGRFSAAELRQLTAAQDKRVAALAAELKAAKGTEAELQRLRGELKAVSDQLATVRTEEQELHRRGEEQAEGLKEAREQAEDFRRQQAALRSESRDFNATLGRMGRQRGEIEALLSKRLSEVQESAARAARARLAEHTDGEHAAAQEALRKHLEGYVRARVAEAAADAAAARRHSAAPSAGSEAPAPQEQAPQPRAPPPLPPGAGGLPRHWPWRAAAARRTIAAAWGAYRINALGKDELNPVTNASVNWDRTNVQMVSLVDALSTLWVAGLRDEFAAAVAHVGKNFLWRPSGNVALFETTIRVLGGLLSAYALSGEAILLEKARDVGNSLVGAYSEGVMKDWGGYPRHVWNPLRKQPGPGYGTFLAEVGSVQLEWRYLAHATGEARFDTGVTRVMDRLEEASAAGGGFIGCCWSSHVAGGWGGTAGLGSYSDSYYEYLLKQYLLTGRSEERYMRMYTNMAETLIDKLIVRTGNLTWLAEGSAGGGTVTAQGSRFEHLACFAPGMLALGATYLPPEQAERHLAAARSLGDFCVGLYDGTPSGLAPDEVSVSASGVSPVKRSWPLRPETAESLFYLWRVTREEQWREAGWRMYRAIERNCRVCKTCAASGYSEVDDVYTVPGRHTGHMDTFFLAETMKYLYLLFAEDSEMDLDCWVFNTEAHPLPVIPPIGAKAAARGVPPHCPPLATPPRRP
eukprot:TRINITY_DN6777_c0_g1_i1.p1 TRINITY_DN6777_c0_g1~~TRINITY_DN6777_c0_g1_i1.p1  ORF type:complete len:757 (+),score=221.58 TRINITY_DN6777_c0_g1_i1:85-2271(+)